MPRRKSGILTAQEKYLETGDASHVESLYRQLVQLGMHILTRRGGRFQEPEDVLDIAADVCMRLMERGEPVLRSAPSAYMTLALFYKRKGGKVLEDIDGLEIPAKDPVRQGYDEYAEDLMEDLDAEGDIEALVRRTLESRISWRAVCRSLPDPEMRRRYRQSMKEVEQCARESARHRDAAV